MLMFDLEYTKRKPSFSFRELYLLGPRPSRCLFRSIYFGLHRNWVQLFGVSEDWFPRPPREASEASAKDLK